MFFPSNGRYAEQIWKETQKRRVCQIRTSYSDVVTGQKEVGAGLEALVCRGK